MSLIDISVSVAAAALLRLGIVGGTRTAAPAASARGPALHDVSHLIPSLDRVTAVRRWHGSHHTALPVGYYGGTAVARVSPAAR